MCPLPCLYHSTHSSLPVYVPAVASPLSQCSAAGERVREGGSGDNHCRQVAGHPHSLTCPLQLSPAAEHSVTSFVGRQRGFFWAKRLLLTHPATVFPLLNSGGNVSSPKRLASSAPQQ
ncbi:UNVERIFIED_CONTAM: hypothetical protein K2H54_035937 [Gekko kuhli]